MSEHQDSKPDHKLRRMYNTPGPHMWRLLLSREESPIFRNRKGEMEVEEAKALQAKEEKALAEQLSQEKHAAEVMQRTQEPIYALASELRREMSELREELRRSVGRVDGGGDGGSGGSLTYREHEDHTADVRE